MAYKVVVSSDADQDLNLIFRHFVDSYISLGDTSFEAFERAVRRVSSIEAQLTALGRMPHQGTLRPHLGPDIRHVTKDRTVFYFQIDETAKVLRVIAVFFGGQDHQRHMLKRLGGA